MKIIRTNIANLEEDKKTLYRMTKAAGINAKDAIDGNSYPVQGFLIYEDTNSDGEINEILAVLVTNFDGSTTVLNTVSDTFKREFLQIVDIMGVDPFAIYVKHGKSKAGREYVTCELDCD